MNYNPHAKPYVKARGKPRPLYNELHSSCKKTIQCIQGF